MSLEEKMGKYIKLSILSSSHVSITPKPNTTTVQATQIKQVITSTTTTTTTTTTTSSTSTSSLTTTTTSTKMETKAVKVYNDNETIPSSLGFSIQNATNDLDLFDKNEKVIIKALIYFNKANNEPNINNFIPRIPNYFNKDSIQSEKEFYIAIERLIQNKIIEQQSYSVSDALANTSCSSNTINDSNYGLNQVNSQSYSNIDKLINKAKESNQYLEFIAIKAIMISLINIINERLQKIFNLNFSGDTIDVDCDIFNDIYNEYTIMSNIYSFLEKDFALSFDSFKLKYQMSFCFKDLFRDLFWDYVFKIKQLNCLFVNSFNSDRLSAKTHSTMKEIIKELYLIEFSLKKDIGMSLRITSITSERCFFACFILKNKPQYELSIVQKDNPISDTVNVNNIHKMHTDELFDDQCELEEIEELRADAKRSTNNRSLSQETENIKHPLINYSDLLQEDIPSFQDQCDMDMGLDINEHQSAAKLIESLQSKEANFLNCHPKLEHFNSIEDISINTNSNLNIKSKGNANVDTKDNHNANVKDNTISNNDKFSSIDELYNYIVNDHPHPKKKNRKKGKPKSTIIPDNNSNANTNTASVNQITELDAIVEQFKLDLNIKASDASNVQKIKPKISIEWLKSISSN